MKKEELINLLRSLNIENNHNTVNVKNLYFIYSMINDPKIFNFYINNDGIGVRNPHKAISLKKNLVNGIKQKIKVTREITLHNLDAKKQYCLAIIYMAEMIQKLGYEFSDEEVERVNKAAEKLKKYDKIAKLTMGERVEHRFINNYIFRVSLKDEEYTENFEAGFKKAFEVLSDTKKTNQYIHDLVAPGGNWPVFPDGILHSVCDLVCTLRINMNDTINSNAAKIMKIHQLKKRVLISYRSHLEHEQDYLKDIKEDIGENKFEEYNELIEQILEEAKKVSKNSSDLPFYLYKILNEKVRYNTVAFSWNQRDNDVQRIINHHRAEDINQNRNSITCHSVSEAMADLLERAGYEAFIVGGAGHQYVMFFDENQEIYIADSLAGPNRNSPNLFLEHDSIRMKLGLVPNGLYRYDGRDEYLNPKHNLYDNGRYISYDEYIKGQKETKDRYKFDINDFKNNDGKIEIKKIIKFIDENPDYLDEIRELLYQKYNLQGENIVSFMNAIIKSAIKGNEDDSLLVYALIRQMCAFLQDKNGDMYNIKYRIQQKTAIPILKIGFSVNLYRKTAEGSEFVPIIYVKDKFKMRYYIWTHKEGLINISRAQVQELVEAGKLHSSSNNYRDESKWILPGIRAPFVPIEKERECIFENLK